MSTPFRERNPVIIGAMSLAVIAALILAAFRADDLPLIGGGDTYYAAFSEAGGLKANDEVRVAGVRVGKVDAVELDGNQVKVTFKVERGSRLRQGLGRLDPHQDPARVHVPRAGAGRQQPAPEESTIPVERTTSPYDVVEAFAGLADTSERIDTAQLTESLSTLADLGRNTPDEFRETLEGVSAISETLASRDEQINTLLTNLQKVSGVLGDRSDDIITLMKDGDVLFKALVARRQAIHNLLVSTSTMSEQLTLLIRESRADLEPALTHLDTVVGVLLKNQDNLDSTLRLMAPFYRVFANTLGNGPWFDTYIYNMPPIPQAG